MKTLRLQNYRCFEDTGDIELKPITYLLGANSAGKSSFLKFFALLKQSLGVKLNGVFLWSDDDVDFKDFRNTVKDGEDEMTVSFTLCDVPLFKRRTLRRDVISEIKITMKIAPKGDNNDYLKELHIEWGESQYPLSITIGLSNNISVEYIRCGNFILPEDEYGKNKPLAAINIGLLPIILFKTSEYISDDVDFVEDYFLKCLDNSKDNRIIRTIDILSLRNLSSRDKLLDFITKSSKNIKFRDNVNINYFIDLIVFSNLNNVLNSINIYLLNLAEQIHYVQPLRAITRRYYRFQNYAVSELDSDGTNLPMFFNSLSDEGRDDFNGWISSILKVKFDIKPKDGFLELVHIDENGKERNLIDVGFGFTQVLPILVLIWKVVFLDNYIDKKKKRNLICKTHIIAIEQPELHLHPRLQAQFAELVAKAINECKSRGSKVYIIIETHSSTIINKSGELIEKGELSKEDINVLIFNGTNEGLNSYVTPASFSTDGYIDNWPYGFFSGE